VEEQSIRFFGFLQSREHFGQLDRQSAACGFRGKPSRRSDLMAPTILI
jgi:hypothetical protein